MSGPSGAASLALAIAIGVPYSGADARSSTNLMTWRKSRSEAPPTEKGRKLSPSMAPKILPFGSCTAAIRMIAPYETAPEMGDGGHAASKDGDTVQQPCAKEKTQKLKNTGK